MTAERKKQTATGTGKSQKHEEEIEAIDLKFNEQDQSFEGKVTIDNWAMTDK